jgi:hypothetical protein
VSSKLKTSPVRLSRTAKSTRFCWTAKLLALLGVVPDVVVAVKAGIDRQAVAAERRRRGIQPAWPRRPRIEWTDEMIELLGTDSDAAVAAQLGIGAGSVIYKRRQLGIPAANPPPYEKARGYPWGPGDVALLGKVSDGELARALGLSTTSVTCKRQRLGIAPFRKPPARIEWTPQKIERLGQVPDTQVARELRISLGSVRAKRHELGIPAFLDNRPVERNEEVAALLLLPDTEVVHRTGLNRHTIERLRRDLGVPEPAATAPGPVPEGAAEEGGSKSSHRCAASRRPGGRSLAWRSGYRWRPEEIALLGSAPDAEVAARIGRSTSAVRARRQTLGILHRRLKSWLPQEIELLGTAPDSEIAERLDRSVKAVHHKRCRLGIPAFEGSRSPGEPQAATRHH